MKIQKVNIIRTVIDTDKLVELITDYQETNGETFEYLVMSARTYKEALTNSEYFTYKSPNMTPFFMDIQILTDPYMQHGDIKCIPKEDAK